MSQRRGSRVCPRKYHVCFLKSVPLNPTLPDTFKQRSLFLRNLDKTFLLRKEAAFAVDESIPVVGRSWRSGASVSDLRFDEHRVHVTMVDGSVYDHLPTAADLVTILTVEKDRQSTWELTTFHRTNMPRGIIDDTQLWPRPKPEFLEKRSIRWFAATKLTNMVYTPRQRDALSTRFIPVMTAVLYYFQQKNVHQPHVHPPLIQNKPEDQDRQDRQDRRKLEAPEKK